MAKADVRRDYYADLGLAPSAEGEDIKKQFRKLALKYHPDKNPGKEAEFNAKFQAIKTAHDLLSDPQQRLKYDTDRLRAGYGKVSGPPKTNTSRRAQPQPTAFRPTPPRPQYNPPPFTKPQPTSNGPSSGAKRYEAHARAGPTSWHKPRDEGQTRADAFKGFSGMRGAAGWRGFDPNTGGSTAGGTPRQQNQPFGKPRPQSAYERFQESYRTQNPSSTPHSPKKRNGYAPGASGDDEPMARNTSAYTSSSRPSSMYFDSPPRAPTAKKPVVPDLPQFHPEYERASSRYATAGGEKTFFTSSGLGRSSTVRTPSGGYRTSSARTNPPSPTPSQHGRHRSVSPKSGRNREYSVSETSSDLDDDEEDIPEPQPKPKAVPKSRMRHRQKFPDLYGNDSSSSTGEDPRARQGQKHSRLSPSPEGFWKYRRNSGSQDGNADLNRNQGHNSDSAAFPKGQQGPFSNPASRYDALRPHPSRKSNSSFFYMYSPDSAQSKPTSQPMFGRDSPSNLHKKFSEEDWREHINKFDFLGAHATSKDAFRSSSKGSADREKTAKLYRDFQPRKAENYSHPKFANMSIDDLTQPPQVNPLRTSPVSQSQGRATNSTGSGSSRRETGRPGLDSFAPTTGTGPQPQAQPQQAPTPFAQAKFSAEQWSEQLRNIPWNPSDTHKPRQANTPPSRSPKKPPAKVTTEAEENKGTTNGDTPLESTPTPPIEAEVEPEAMDLDDEIPAVHPTASSASGHGSASGSANTSYPDLNGNAAGSDSGASKQTAMHHTVNGASKAETRTPLFNLDNLRNTAPFTSTNSGGIENLEDVFATLPFESKARQQATTKEEIQPRKLELPNPPKRPRAPDLVLQPGSQTLMLSRDKWNYYVSTMGSYMHDWNIFNRRMLLHFNTRQDAIETGLAPGWISAVGDTARLRMNGADGDATPEKSQGHAEVDEADIDDLVPDRRTGGYSAYLRGIEEDVQVRKHWDVACELHRECIVDLGRLREWIRRGGKVI
ncbi:Heat shock protein DnaJ N-terminal [Penicillium waksmanii]|uniref:Heat shock protein DnaJ N-terminal n=1 Tax=Penicillium waksmanii TaxID=69791 RepID=UPI0025491227|nr:Heat shock protein DnaJ N-terminal [Penicillium waksmanii]KAJ5983244.1 Heat shock protein DnaJ N-terminal [Penicillium waksmanii]